MDHLKLSAITRTTIGKTVDHLRRANKIPAVVYGHGIKSVALELDAAEFTKVYKLAGATSLVDLSIDQGAPVKVLIHDLKRHSTRRSIEHVDLYQVRMTEKIEAEIELSLTGESVAVKEQGGTLVRAMDKVKVQCLPGDLVSAIMVDISALKTFEDKIHVGDLTSPKGITIMSQPEEVIASVTPPRTEAELEALSGEVKDDVAAVEVEKKGKEEEEGEGDAAAPAETSPEPKPKAKKE